MSSLFLIALFPLLGFVINGLVGARLPKPVPGVIACLAMGGAFVMALLSVISLNGKPDARVVETLYTWMNVGSFRVDVEFMLDHLSAVMILIITGIGLLIHIYSVGYMQDDHNDPQGQLYARYFAILNLFVAFMSVLVLANNFLLTFVGWEGVGLCSYFLIGYWFTRTDAAEASKKAFIANRVGDWGFLLAMTLIFIATGTLRYYNAPNGGEGLFDLLANHHDPTTVTQASTDILESFNKVSLLGVGGFGVICVLLLLAATGKSAQIPLFTWLPDAMAGPTPVSALIHAATMVTAGIYMVARCAPLFERAPHTKVLICGIGALTALCAGLTALAHTDIKKVLAYSTVSQLGFMFMGVGAGAYTAAIFHVFTHAFFKACLFLCAGSVIHALHGEQDMRQMGGLKAKMPITHFTFLVSALALAGAVPFAGFFSKDEIIGLTYAAGTQYPLYYLFAIVGLFTAFVTATYAGRQYAQIFSGQPRNEHLFDHAHESPLSMTLPLCLLAVGAALAGFLGLPAIFPHNLPVVHTFANYLEPVMPHVTESTGGVMPLILLALGAAIGWGGWLYGCTRGKNAGQAQLGTDAQRFSLDAVYRTVIGQGGLSVAAAARWFDQKVVDGIVNGVGGVVDAASSALRITQTSFVRNYLLCMALGAFVVIAYFVYGAFALGQR